MNKLLAGIAALSLSITSPTIANAKQIVTPIITEDTNNISETSLSYGLKDKQLIAQTVARLDFNWNIAPLELAGAATRFIFNANGPEVAAYVLLLLSGHDVYVVRAKLHNTGNVPLRVYPQRIKVYYGNKSTSVIPIADNRFLQPDILRPNYYINKPVIFIAPSNLNLLRDVKMGYRDNSIQVR